MMILEQQHGRKGEQEDSTLFEILEKKGAKMTFDYSGNMLMVKEPPPINPNKQSQTGY